MFVTSIVEVVAPGIDNLLIVLDNYIFDFTKLLPVQLVIVGKFDLGLQPKLGFAIPTIRVNMSTRFLAREEVQAIAVLPKHRGAQDRLLFGHRSVA